MLLGTTESYQAKKNQKKNTKIRPILGRTLRLLQSLISSQNFSIFIENRVTWSKNCNLGSSIDEKYSSMVKEFAFSTLTSSFLNRVRACNLNTRNKLYLGGATINTIITIIIPTFFKWLPISSKKVIVPNTTVQRLLHSHSMKIDAL